MTGNHDPLSRKNLAFFALIAFGLLLVFMLRSFITPFLGAVIFYTLFNPWIEHLTTKRKWRRQLAAVLIILLSFVIILIPVLGLSYLLYGKISQVSQDPSSLFGRMQELIAKVNAIAGSEVLSDTSLNELKVKATSYIPGFIEEFALTLGNIAIMYFILYYMLMESERMQREVKKLLPFDSDNMHVLSDELDSQTRSNVIAVPLVAVIQGAAAGIGYWIFGIPDPVFWAAITAFLSILPLFGTTLVWIPAGLLLIATGDTWMGLGLLAYGGVVVINIDNLARLVIQKRFADVHPLITVFGVIIGLDLFGLPGLIFGPLMMSYFVILVRMYRRVYHTDKTEKVS